ncbi:NADP-dependent oxidoreductase [Nocardia shimofusensis]|uniref:NADP-dependent oxidoreductase n=1 Tax=Nocardia shimofusensis TaxID=228596 RepID=UPI000831E854|nr:NADP-dependent oxidoreductase [Nocardia shimofusensis]
MKAAILPTIGAPDLLLLGEVPDLPVGPTDIAVSVAAAAVNPVDLKTRSGFLKLDLQFPAVLGWDVAGVVTAVGEQVRRFAPGDRVIGMIAQPAHRYGTYAERVVADQELFAPAPSTVPLTEAAAIPLAALTARQTLGTLSLAPDARVLVTGGAGAVGRIAVQLLRHRGHSVGAVARAGDADDLCDLGVVWTGAVDRVEERGWDAVVDTAGLASSIAAVRDDGAFVSIDDNEQPRPQRGITPHKSYVDENGSALAELVAMIDAGQLRVPVARSYALADVARAHTDVAGGGIRGKVLVIP